MMGGDRQTLTPSRHFVHNSTLHHNQRWILNYAPDIFMGGVGNSASFCEIYGSPQIAVFVQGNDHTLSNADIHDAARQCSDCGAFYMGPSSPPCLLLISHQDDHMLPSSS